MVNQAELDVVYESKTAEYVLEITKFSSYFMECSAEQFKCTNINCTVHNKYFSYNVEVKVYPIQWL